MTSDTRPDPPDVDCGGPSVRPEIWLGSELAHIVDEAEESLSRDPGLYVRGGQLVQAIGSEMDALDVSIQAIGVHNIRVRLARCARYMRRKKDGDASQVWPSRDIAAAVAASGSYPNLRRLDGVTSTPQLRPDGTVLQAPGYDPATALLYIGSGIDIERVKNKPTRKDAKQAVATLFGVVEDFPFETPADRTGWLAMVLTLFCRHAVKGNVPLFLVEANIRGSGKTLLAQCAGMIASGTEHPAMPAPATDEELAKRITASAMAGREVILLDNIAGKFGWPSLDIALTSQIWEDRILGGSTMLRIRLWITWIVTANNALFGADTLRRTQRIRLISDTDRPEGRSGFKHPDLRAWIERERPRLVHAALTILRAFTASGEAADVPVWGSFESWSRLVRGAIVWAGEADPFETHAKLVEHSDLKAGALSRLLETWTDVDAHAGGLTVSELRQRLSRNSDDHIDFREALLELVPTRGDSLPSSRSIGKAFASFRDTPADGMRMAQVGKHKRAAIWCARAVVKKKDPDSMDG